MRVSVFNDEEKTEIVSEDETLLLCSVPDIIARSKREGMPLDEAVTWSECEAVLCLSSERGRSNFGITHHRSAREILSEALKTGFADFRPVCQGWQEYQDDL